MIELKLYREHDGCYSTSERVGDDVSGHYVQKTDYDELALKNTELKVALCEISNMCIGNLTMSYSIDPDYVGRLIYEATGMTNPELNKSVKDNL
jgi:hypothetical protein